MAKDTTIRGSTVRAGIVDECSDELVPCPCIARGAIYGQVGPDHDGSPEFCEMCEDTGEVPRDVAHRAGLA